jgi:hypothetical protein
VEGPSFQQLVGFVVQVGGVFCSGAALAVTGGVVAELFPFRLQDSADPVSWASS